MVFIGYSKSILSECGSYMARRSEHSRDEIKSMILEAAENIVREQGFSALKIRQISADMGYTVASVYMVFANMDDLNIQIKTRTTLNILTVMSKENEPMAVAMAYFDFVLKERGLCQMLIQHQVVKTLVSEVTYDEAQAKLQLCLCDALMANNLDHHTEQQIQDASRALISAIQGVCLPLLMQKAVNQETVKANVELLVTCFLRGWRKQ